MSNTSPNVNTIKKNNIKIIGDNVLFNNGIITAFYIIPLTNYSTASAGGVLGSIESLTNMITNLTTNNPTLTFTIERIEKVIQAKDVVSNLYNTIHLYAPDYQMPDAFVKRIEADRQNYCLLGIDIQLANVTDVEDLTIKDTVKALMKQAANAFAGLGNTNADPEQILKQEENIYRTISNKCVRASKELVFYNYISKVYPCYEISYDKLSYINENTFEDIMGSVTQTVSDNFGWFEMHNEGMDIFDVEADPTYGCMLTVHAFPAQINAINFPMDFMNVVTTVQCMTKDEAKLKLKRTRSSDRFERDQAIKANAEFEQVEEAQNNIDIATMAIQDVEAGEVICNFNTSILIIASTRDELKSRTMEVVTECKDRNILVAKSLTQSLDFLDNYINKKPKKFIHLAPISFPLSFQQNAGAMVGDTPGMGSGDTAIGWSPAIGSDI